MKQQSIRVRGLLDAPKPSQETLDLIRAGWLPMGVHRIDRADISLVGWRARFTVKGVTYGRFFGDAIWNGSRNALHAAAGWIDDARAQRRYAKKMRKPIKWGAPR